jgi:hypothetical protein
MTGLRRLVQATHVLRLELPRHTDDRPVAALRPLATALDQTLAIIAEALATGTPSEAVPPPLRAPYSELSSDAGGSAVDHVLLTDLDEIVDAANTVADLLELPGGEPVRGAHGEVCDSSAVLEGGSPDALPLSIVHNRDDATREL